MDLALTVLLSGLIVVFSVLILLIVLIKSYSIVVCKIESKVKRKKISKETSVSVHAEEKISPEIIAVISAAVASLYDGQKVKYEIKSLKRRRKGKSIWAAYGRCKELSPF